MRPLVLLPILGVLATAAPAVACPITRCAVSGALEAEEHELKLSDQVPSLVLEGVPLTRASVIETSPLLWVQLKTYIYHRLPRHHGASFDAVLVGMSFATPDETVAALGLEGNWR